MGRHLSLRYDHVIYVSRYPVLTAVSNILTTSWICNVSLQAPTLARECESVISCYF